ncbi:MAG: class I SAM-dependent methyltransferase [Syntrophus sp. (in: bacteria)]|nr:class I SAM-dependent methyltransferase [Syntrophus sp. (in: bacteria)]
MIDENEKLQQFLNAHMASGEPIVLLEAGCGSVSHISFNNLKKVVGIDISKERLDRNPHVQERIVGDLQTYPLPEKAYDVIICWNVMEHIFNPRLAVENFINSLKKQGIIVLAFPNLFSLKGLVTKFTPYAFHVFFYRYIIGDKRKEDFEQFPTYLRYFIEPHHLRSFVESRNFSVDYFRLYEGPVQKHWRNRFRVINGLFALLGFISRVLTLNRMDLNLTDCIMVLRLKTD